MQSKIKELISYKELIWNLVIRNLKVRYKNSSLGFFWSFLNPVFIILIYYFFIRLMRFQMNLTGLLSGIIPWHFLSMCLGDSVESISGNSTLITKVRFPRIILTLSTIFANLINYTLSLIVLIFFLPILGCAFSWNLVFLPVVIFVTFIFVLGLSLMLATCNVYFKDTPHLLSIFMMAWFFMTPIIYPLTQIPERFRNIAFLNPMTDIIALYRFSFLGDKFIFTFWQLSGFLIIFLILVFGIKIFYKFEHYFADEL